MDFKKILKNPYIQIVLFIIVFALDFFFLLIALNENYPQLIRFLGTAGFITFLLLSVEIAFQN